MSQNQRYPKVKSIKCDDLFYAIPRSVCAASVANCIIKQCHAQYPNGYLINSYPQRQYLEWKRKCSQTNEFCHNHDKKDLNDLVPVEFLRGGSRIRASSLQKH